MKNFYFLCLIVFMCGFILTIANAQENQQHQIAAKLEITEIEKRLPEIEHKQQVLQEQLGKEIDENRKHKLEEKLVNLVMDELSLKGRLANLTMERPAPEYPIEMKIGWHQKRIKVFDNAINHLNEIMEVIHIPEFRERLDDKIQNFENNRNGLKEELMLIEKPKYQDDKHEIDESAKKESFLDNLKHPAVIAAIISAIAIIVAALLKRK